MNIYITHGDYKRNYHNGIGIVLANSEEEAKELLRKKNKHFTDTLNDIDNIKFKVYPVDSSFVIHDAFGSD